MLAASNGIGQLPDARKYFFDMDVMTNVMLKT
jgi:hypothetical protein